MSGEIFLKGDIAVCINNNRCRKKLTAGKEYLVRSSHFGKLLITDDNGFRDYFPAEWFTEGTKSNSMITVRYSKKNNF